MRITMLIIRLFPLIKQLLILNTVHQHIRKYIVYFYFLLLLLHLRSLHEILIEGDRFK